MNLCNAGAQQYGWPEKNMFLLAQLPKISSHSDIKITPTTVWGCELKKFPMNRNLKFPKWFALQFRSFGILFEIRLTKRGTFVDRSTILFSNSWTIPKSDRFSECFAVIYLNIPRLVEIFAQLCSQDFQIPAPLAPKAPFVIFSSLLL